MSEQITLVEELEKCIDMHVVVILKNGAAAGGILKKCGTDAAVFEQQKPEFRDQMPTGKKLLVRSCVPFDSIFYFETIANNEETSFT